MYFIKMEKEREMKNLDQYLQHAVTLIRKVQHSTSTTVNTKYEMDLQ